MHRVTVNVNRNNPDLNSGFGCWFQYVLDGLHSLSPLFSFIFYCMWTNYTLYTIERKYTKCIGILTVSLQLLRCSRRCMMMIFLKDCYDGFWILGSSYHRVATCDTHYFTEWKESQGLILHPVLNCSL